MQYRVRKWVYILIKRIALSAQIQACIKYGLVHRIGY